MNYAGESPKGPPKEKVSTLPFEAKFSGKGTAQGRVSEKLDFEHRRGNLYVNIKRNSQVL